MAEAVEDVVHAHDGASHASRIQRLRRHLSGRFGHDGVGQFFITAGDGTSDGGHPELLWRELLLLQNGLQVNFEIPGVIGKLVENRLKRHEGKKILFGMASRATKHQGQIQDA